MSARQEVIPPNEIAAPVPGQAEAASADRGGEPARPREAVRRGLSLVSRGARVHYVTAVAMTSIIPLLALVYVAMAELPADRLDEPVLLSLGAVVLGVMVLGYFMLARYPASIIRLRRNLDALARGDLNVRVDLARDEDDLAAIESSMKAIIAQADARIRTIESQSNALLEAERQRTVIEGLGAVCHHIGQPTTALTLSLYLLQKAKTPEETQMLLDQCRQAAEKIAEIVQKLQRTAAYRTEPYLDDNTPGAGDPAARRILKID